jgi:hypothetical protein
VCVILIFWSGPVEGRHGIVERTQTGRTQEISAGWGKSKRRMKNSLRPTGHSKEYTEESWVWMFVGLAVMSCHHTTVL